MNTKVQKAKSAGAAIDPVTLAVVWNRLNTVVYEAGERVVRSASSYVMANARDLGTVLLNPEAEILALASCLPVHGLSAEFPVKATIKRFGHLKPGDMVIGNDGYIMQSGHLPDWVFIVPIYYKKELLFYMHFRGHQMDTGGAFPGGYFPRAFDCIAEGLNIPPVKIIEGGEVNQQLKELIFNNVRGSAAGWSDLMLIYGSMTKVEADVLALVDKYGMETVRACGAEMVRRGEAAMRAEISKVPDGIYYGEQAVDSDGTVKDRPVWIRTKITVKGDEMTVDFSDTDKQVDFINTPLGTTYTYVFVPLFLAFSQTLPHNHGAMVPVHIITKPGTVVNPTRPATYGSCACFAGTQIADAVTHALAQAIPDEVVAPFSQHFSTDYGGRLPMLDPRTGAPLEFFGAPFLEEGGSGACKGFDGWDGVLGMPMMGGMERGSVEINELFSPFRYNVVKLAQDSEGPGEFTGSRGVYAERECLIPEGGRMILFSGCCNGESQPPRGIAGAPAAPVGTLRIKRAKKSEIEMFSTMDQTEMDAGDVLITTPPGGAGWGDPLNRTVGKVLSDVRAGLVSAKRAKDVYGVVMKPNTTGDLLATEVDAAATEKLRARLKTKKAA